ncbi:MmgE/PrpD family protein, partial [Burkholderia sp. SIMBA_024]|uniref:MmgE/PrpD family protein n=1 Tax=Burkholderia sp. SIMBA_024 TaxID=3085768 RepID=UPI003979C9C4
AFIHELRAADLPDRVVAQARRCLIDLVGVAAAGAGTPMARLIADHAADQFAAGGTAARIMFDGRRVSPAGAALAGGMAID